MYFSVKLRPNQEQRIGIRPNTENVEHELKAIFQNSGSKLSPLTQAL